MYNMKVKVVLKDVKMVRRHELFKNIPLHIQELNCEKNIKHCQLHNQNLLN
jgi:hypothetical protein